MGFVPKWSRGDQKKTSASAPKQGVRQMPSLFHGAKDAQYSGPALFADGGEVDEATLKAEGLKASEGEKVGLWERLKAGNIDEPGSEAYNRFGAGRGRIERDFKAADAQMDQLDRMKSDAESNRQMDQIDALKKNNAAAQAERDLTAREDSRDAEMSRLMRTAKPVAKPAAQKPSAPVDWKNAPDESPAETARIASAARKATERAEVPRAGMVSARPKLNWSTPADRARWDEKYKATHNEDGSSK